MFRHTTSLMGTVVTIEVVGGGEGDEAQREREQRVADALDWMRLVERSCTRFDASSEVMQLTARAGDAVPVSRLLFEAVRYAIAVAEASGGAFDPTVGQEMESRGFNQEYRTGQLIRTELSPKARASYRDVFLDDDAQAITLARPLILDLGAVAKGLAVDMASRALEPCVNYAIDAGGDLYLAGTNGEGRPWSVGIRHPRDREQLIETLRVRDTAVCTSGDYERRLPAASGHHILDARDHSLATSLASVTVVAPSAMVADALATAAFALGPTDGLAFLEDQGVDALLVTPALERLATDGMRKHVSAGATFEEARR